MRKFLFTSPLRHWKNGDKKMAVSAYFFNVATVMVTTYVVKTLVERAYEVHPVAVWTEQAEQAGML